MDEPFSAIDIVTRHQMQKFLLDIHQEFSKTIIMITHQVDEALLLADRVLIFG
jgi:NitT/TauT family transport system ATP-binding protein